MYEFKLTDELVISTLIGLTLISGIKMMPFNIKHLSLKQTVVRMTAGIMYLIIFTCCIAYSAWDIMLGISIGHWSSYEVYAENGSVLAFILEVQEMHVNVPDKYSPQETKALLDTYEYSTHSDLPTVIVVMNETFCDLTYFVDFKSEECLSNWYNMDCVIRGNTYVSTYGGGTCNSEYEFLTGNSLANFPGNICPYTMYNFEHVHNLAGIFKKNGYNTIAIHPENRNNWNRASVYSQMGFQRFISADEIGAMSTIRGIVSDYSNYDSVIKAYEESEGPSFIFNITLQNHGGYGDIEALGDIEPVKVGDEFQHYTDLITYLTLIRESDKAFKYLIDYFSNVDEQVIVCMFGDHQPGGLNSELINLFSDENSEDIGIIEKRYCVPYLVWANYSNNDFPSNQHKDISLNYLGANVLALAGIDPPYTNYLMNLEKKLPIINRIGYMDDNEIWHGFEEQNEYVDDYKKMGYFMMFDNKNS